MSRDRRGERTQEVTGSIFNGSSLLRSGLYQSLYLGLYDAHGRRLTRLNRGIIRPRHFAVFRGVSSEQRAVYAARRA